MKAINQVVSRHSYTPPAPMVSNKDSIVVPQSSRQDHIYHGRGRVSIGTPNQLDNFTVKAGESSSSSSSSSPIEPTNPFFIPHEEEIRKNPLCWGIGPKPVLFVKQLMGTPSFYQVIEDAEKRARQEYLRSLRSTLRSP